MSEALIRGRLYAMTTNLLEKAQGSDAHAPTVEDVPAKTAGGARQPDRVPRALQGFVRHDTATGQEAPAQAESAKPLNLPSSLGRLNVVGGMPIRRMGILKDNPAGIPAGREVKLRNRSDLSRVLQDYPNLQKLTNTAGDFIDSDLAAIAKHGKITDLDLSTA